MAELTMLDEYPALIPGTKHGHGRVRRELEFKQAVVELASGGFRTTELWRHGRFGFEVAYEVVDFDLAWDTLMGFYYGNGGPKRSFLLQDWYKKDPKNEVLGRGDGSRKQFKIYGDRFDSVVVRVNGITVSPSAIAPSTGFITLATAPADGAIVTADVVNEKYRVFFIPDEPFVMEYLGGQAVSVGVRMIQQKSVA